MQVPDVILIRARSSNRSVPRWQQIPPQSDATTTTPPITPVHSNRVAESGYSISYVLPTARTTTSTAITMTSSNKNTPTCATVPAPASASALTLAAAPVPASAPAPAPALAPASASARIANPQIDARVARKQNAVPLCARYVPDDPVFLTGNTSGVRALREWITQRKAHDPHSRRAAYVHGPCGSGKSIGVRVLLRDAGYEVYGINAAALMRLGAMPLAEQIRCVATRHALFARYAVLVDEYDAIVQCGAARAHVLGADDGTTLNAVLRALGPGAAPIVFTSSDQSARECRTLADQCCAVRFFAPFRNDVIQLLTRVASREGFTLSRATAETLTDAAHGNLHVALNTLETLITSNDYAHDTRRAALPLRALLEPHRHDAFHSAFDSVRMLLYAPPGSLSVSDAHRLYDSDAGLMHEMLHENYLAAFGSMELDNASPDRLARVAHAADCLSLAQAACTFPDTNTAAATLDAWSVHVCATRGAPRSNRHANADSSAISTLQYEEYSARDMRAPVAYRLAGTDVRFPESLRAASRTRADRADAVHLLRRLSIVRDAGLCSAPLCDLASVRASFTRLLCDPHVGTSDESRLLQVILSADLDDATLASLLGDAKHPLLARVKACRFDGALQETSRKRRTQPAVTGTTSRPRKRQARKV